jgi:hypothetical protein
VRLESRRGRVWPPRSNCMHDARQLLRYRTNRSKPSPHDRRPQRILLTLLRGDPLMTIVLSSIGLLSIMARFSCCDVNCELFVGHAL